MSLRLRLIPIFLLLIAGLRPTLAAPAPAGIEVHALARPELIFACDRPTSQLQELFTPNVIADLAALHAGVALSTEDFTSERAAMAKKLSDAGISLFAWLVLPHDEGYYVNAVNAPQTSERFEAFDRWTRENGLHWQAVGLDIEPSLTEFAAMRDHKLRLAATLIRRAFDAERAKRAQFEYAALIRRMQSRGYRVQTHQLPFIADERKAHTTILERTLGIVDVRGDEEVLMLYTSFNHETGAGMIWAYGLEAQVIAVGSTAGSGDPATDARVPPLNWDEFSRDLIVAAHFTHRVGIYSLEGCVKQGFLPRLKALDWHAPVMVSADALGRGASFRERAQHVLWFLPRLPYINGALLILLIVAVTVWVRRKRRKRTENGNQ